ncbi:citrate lyase subunit beta/citryl-CoA lyase [Sphingomonas kyeonggiensis]|uniref:HpcH/HpaI aldolase/citrate lyase family protein n=1 Tax=Sphingomonas kyeonggiensis TaxID=1268553 RepID=UPI00278297DD|nr:CoA ester lyase [Sphingomonas kyeonggiensis]MDQ0251269.1 citrate lyase subunit beta/citryl-CoA lyase [Sphingomonas kyeonggiensis]
MTTARLAPRTALFLPASNRRAIEKARGLSADLVILDLEDAVKDADKATARTAAVEAMVQGFGPRLAAIRLNGIESGEHLEDVAAVAASHADFAVLPKAESAADVAQVAKALGKPLLAMIETPLGVLAAAEIAAVPGVSGLIAGTNDLAASLRLPPSSGRGQMGVALQTIVLAARANAVWALDGVFNRLDDPEALAAECREGRALGYDGKSLIHPNQIEIAARAFGPTEQELAEARALIAAATGGAERYEGRMIETMHVDQARALLARASDSPVTEHFGA